MRLYILFLIGFLLINNPVWSQQIIPAQIGQSIILDGDEFRGTIQWQSSPNSEQWSDIEGAIVDPYEIMLTVLPIYFRAEISEENCDVPHYSEIIQVISSDVKRWSDPGSWPNGKPEAGDEVIIPQGESYLLDENTPNLGGLVINGILTFDRLNLELTVDHIFIDGGRLQIGSEENPFEQKAIITLNGTDTGQEVNTRGITVLGGGELELHGDTPDVLWTKIDADVPNDGSTVTIELSENVNWNEGDTIVLAPTDYYLAGSSFQSVTQRFRIEEINGNVLTIDRPSQANVWGVMQYISENGVTLNASEQDDPHVEGVPMSIDERAEIGLLTRNIVVQAPNDALWQNQYFGMHIMIMPDGSGRLDGVELRRGGQAGHLRRYPFHYHMLNISEDLTQYVDQDFGQYVRNSVVHESEQRGFVVHGTSYTEVTNNIAYDVKGHAFFTEDGTEKWNTFDHNLALHVRDARPGYQLQQHEILGDDSRGASGFWLSNPANEITNNVAADCGTFGIWLAYAEQPWGLSENVVNPLDGQRDQPNRTEFGVFINNSAHSNRVDGIHLDNPAIDNEGNTTGKFYASTVNGREGSWPYDNHRRFTLEGGTVHHNGGPGLWDRSRRATTTGVVSSTNAGRYFAGAGALGLIEKTLVVRESLNYGLNGTVRPANADCFSSECGGAAAFASYHYSFSFSGNTIVGFELIPDRRSGAFDAADLYIRANEFGHDQVENQRLINSHGGIMLDPLESHYTLSSVIKDPNGIWGPSDSYFVLNHPFIVSGEGFELHEDPQGSVSGGISMTGGNWGGIRGFILNGLNEEYNDLWAIHVDKFNSNMEKLSEWSVAAANASSFLNHMRDAALHDHSIYELSFPENDPPETFSMLVDGLVSEDHFQVIGIEFSGEIDPSTVNLSAYNNSVFIPYQPVESLQEVIDASAGEVWWQDKANNMVYVKIRGGRWEFWTTTEDSPDFEETTYQTMTLSIE